MIEHVIAALNDEQSLKNSEALSLLTEILVENDQPVESENALHEVLSEYQSETAYTGVASSIIEKMASVDSDSYVDYLTGLESRGKEFIPFYDPRYPKSLYKISEPPLGLYIDGNPAVLDDCVAVVGTRQANDHRIEFARRIAERLVKMNKTVVSGLANGIDAAAHETTLKSGGKTVAILPGDVETVRPSGNKEIGEKIPNSGALIAELSDKKSMHKGRYVERNRLTSGISSAVIVGASGETGGTIHQADFAKDQNKRMYIYEPDVSDGQSPKKLYHKGFLPFNTVDELEEMMEEEFVPGDSGPGSPSRLDDF
jgi:DNA processing protein